MDIPYVRMAKCGKNWEVYMYPAKSKTPRYASLVNRGETKRKENGKRKQRGIELYTRQSVAR